MTKRVLLILGTLLLLTVSAASAAPEQTSDGEPGGEAAEPQVIALKYKEGEPKEAFDGAMTEAVRRFQRDKGLEADGVVGPKTRAALLQKDGEQASEKEDAAVSEAEAATESDEEKEKSSEAEAVKESDEEKEKSSEVEAVKETETEEAKEAETEGAKTAEANGEGTVPRGEPVWVDAVAYSPEGAGMGAYTVLGLPCGRGVIAVDPDFIPLGTRVYIPGYGEAVAADTGTSIVGNIIDICFDTYDESAEFGRQQMEIYILEYP